MIRYLLSAALPALVAVILMEPGIAEEVMPGTKPKEELHVELLQARTFCRAIDIQLGKVRKAFPKLGVQILAAETTWKASPFATGAKAIEDDIKKQSGKRGAEMLHDIDAGGLKLMKEYSIDVRNELEALEFLGQVESRARGNIEFLSIRGNLLWQNKQYQDNPEKEFEHGYVVKTTHTAEGGPDLSFSVPMSWKRGESVDKRSMAFTNCYGHGNVICIITVEPLVLDGGMRQTAEEAYESYEKDTYAAELKAKGATLKTFTKTKMNGMPAVMLTMNEPFAQLDVKGILEKEDIRVFHKGHMIAFQILTAGPEDSDLGAKRIQKNEALFKGVASSLLVK